MENFREKVCEPCMRLTHVNSTCILCIVIEMHVSESYLDKSELQRLKVELEARAQRELDAKLGEVNAHLMEQARARERLDKVRDANETELRKEFENMKKELLVSWLFIHCISCAIFCGAVA